MFKAVNVRHSCRRHHLGNEKASEPEKKTKGKCWNFNGDGGWMCVFTLVPLVFVLLLVVRLGNGNGNPKWPMGGNVGMVGIGGILFVLLVI